MDKLAAWYILCFRKLDNNNITGGIPPEFGNLSSLTILNLGRNNLNGSIPDSLGQLSKLQIL
jgi:hypothetical protein